MACTSLNHAISKKWQRVTASKYTKAFVILSIIQTAILVILQFRILHRNSSLYANVIYPFVNSVAGKENECTLVITVSRFIILITENIMFVLFNFFQFYFCLNAIFHQNTMQIFAIVIINMGYIILGIVQIVDVKIYRDKIMSICPGIQLDNNLLLYELPHITVLVIIAILMTTLSWKLYRQFGWNVYKKIGGDIEMQKIFKATLIFKMLLKINLLYVILYNVLILPSLFYIFTSNALKMDQTIPMFGSLAILVLIFFFHSLAYASIEKEWKTGIFVFVIFWIIVVSDFAYLTIKLGVVSFIQYGLYSWIILMCIFTICAVLTFAYAIIVMMNFGKGLKEYLDKNSSKKQEHEGSNILDDDNSVNSVVHDNPDIEKGPKGPPNSSSSNTGRFVIDE